MLEVIKMNGVIGVEIGATNIRIAFVDENRNIVSRSTERTDKSSGPEGISQQIMRMISSIKFKGVIRSIGIGSAGPLDSKEGSIVHSTNIGFDYIPIVKPLKKMFNVPVYLVNDCVAGVIGEKEFGYGKKYANIIYVTISSGIGGGILIDNHLLMGEDGNAGEIGHIVVDHQGKLVCGCGRRGHWEAYCGGANASNFIKLRLENKTSAEIEASSLHKISGGDLKKLSSRELLETAEKGDELSLEIVKEMGRLNAIGFSNITNAYDPELITVGGAIALEHPNLILNPIKRLVGQYSVNIIPNIMIIKLEEDVVFYGALALPNYLE